MQRNTGADLGCRQFTCFETNPRALNQVQAHKELPPQATPTTAAAAAPKATGASKDTAGTTPKSKAGKSGGGKSPAVAVAGAKDAVAAAAAEGGGIIFWADRLREFQIDVPASAGLSDLTPDSGESGGLGVTITTAGVGEGGGGDQEVIELDVRGEDEDEDEDGDPAAWDGVGVDPVTVLHHRKHFDMLCRAYEVCCAVWCAFLDVDACRLCIV